MKKVYLTAAVLLAASVYGQELPKVNEMGIPNSPAFVMLDESPANIEKPSNPKALALSLINVWNGNGALEFAPYWLVDHAGYTFNDDINNKTPLLQTLAFSAATTRDNDSVTNIAAGFRIQLFRDFADITAIQNIAGLIAAELAVADPSAINMDEIKRLVKLLNEQRARIRWNIELAAAYSGSSAVNTGLAGNKAGAWLNIRHTPKNFPADLVAVARYSRQFGNGLPDSSFLDAGGSISRQGEDFDLQAEYVYRRDTTLDKGYDRVALIANYQIMPGIVAVASVGKNFDEVDNIFTAFGIKFGLSKQKVF